MSVERRLSKVDMRLWSYVNDASNDLELKGVATQEGEVARQEG